MEINAKNMKVLATKDNITLEDVLTVIKENASEGNLSCMIDGVLPKTVQDELGTLGFGVSTGGRYNEVDTIIRWDG